MQKKALLLATLVPFLWACEDTTGPEGARQVAVRFQAVTPSGAAESLASLSLAPSPAAAMQVAAAPITLTGGGNTLVIEDIRLIVAEIELEGVGGECLGEDDDDCEEFEGGPFLVNLLDGTADQVVTTLIPAGSYSEFEFEVEDLEADEEDDTSRRQVIENLLDEMRQTYSGFPGDASMVVRGTSNGDPFTVYFDAEIEVEQEFASPFRVPEDGAILVNLDPSAWFMVGGQPLDLSAFDGETLEFELEFDFESGIEIERDDD